MSDRTTARTNNSLTLFGSLLMLVVGLSPVPWNLVSSPVSAQETTRRVKPEVAESITRAWNAYRDNDYRSALNHLTPILEKDNLPPDVYFLAGKIYYRQNRFPDANRLFEQSLARLGEHQLADSVQNFLDRSSTLEELNLRRRQYAHFNVLFTQSIPAPLPGTLNQDLQKARRRIGGDLDLFPDERFTVIVYTQPEFRRVIEAPVWSGGVFDGKIHIPYRENSDPPYTQRALDHEYAHALVHKLARNNLPLWFNEGFATFQEFRHARDAFRYRLLKNNPPEKHLVELNDIDELFENRQDRDKARLAYEYGYSLLKVMKERYGWIAIKRIINETGTTSSFDEALDEVTGQSLSSLQFSWENWLTNELRS